ncbi:MAG: exosortase-associated EpsI family protein [Isosphaerales bacterium]
MAQENKISPFPLAELPRVLGTWRAIEGIESKLDPEIASATGSTDSLIRVYQDEKTGEEFRVLVLYGLATTVYAHSPEVCYPANGYRRIGESADHELTEPGSTPVRYRTSYFTKRSGSVGHAVEVCHTFLHNGEWLPDVLSRWKLFRVHNAMFKIQIQREASAGSFEDSPSESLLRELAGQINRRLAEKSGRAKNATKTAQATSSQK